MSKHRIKVKYEWTNGQTIAKLLHVSLYPAKLKNRYVNLGFNQRERFAKLWIFSVMWFSLSGESGSKTTCIITYLVSYMHYAQAFKAYTVWFIGSHGPDTQNNNETIGQSKQECYSLMLFTHELTYEKNNLNESKILPAFPELFAMLPEFFIGLSNILALLYQ